MRAVGSRPLRVGLAALAAAGALAAVTATVAGAEADDPTPPAAGSAVTEAPATTAAHAHTHADADADGEADGESGGDGGGGGGRRHGNPALAPYAERYAAASTEERAAADELRDDVAATLAAYADADDAVAAGYRPPRDPRGRMAHYLDPSVPPSGTVLDPAHPAGLVYETGGGTPVLVGAFFVAPRGSEVPGGAGDLVTWHSHDPACAAFFATAEAPCVGTRRMLHVWTVDTASLTTRRGGTVDVAVVDPFGAPFLASVERVG